MKTRKVFIVGLIILAVLGAAWLAFKSRQNLLPEGQSNVIPHPVLAEAMNGEMVDPAIARKRPLAVMIENHPDGRPQSGLSLADVVYETLAEGGITRFEAFYQTEEAGSIGPVRSAREYFAQIADEWGAVYAHVGGSNEVIAQLKDGLYSRLSDANEYYNGEFFLRVGTRPAPHNVYTSTERLRELATRRLFSTEASYQPWTFKNDEPGASSTAPSIFINFSRLGYEVGWNYKQASNSYERSIYYEPDIDAATKALIVAKTVVVQLVPVIERPSDPLLHVDIALSGQGRALVFQDGKALKGIWKNTAGRTRYYDASGFEIQFNRGALWIELVPLEKETSLKW